MKNPINYIKPFVTKHEPELLMGLGITGLVFSTVWAIRGTIKAVNKINEYKTSKDIDKITFKEGFKLTWRYYLPIVITTGVSIPCIIAGNRVSSKRYAALAAAYTITETALQEYQDKTREILGEKKVKEIQERIDSDRIKNSYKGGNQIIMIDNGDNLFYEPLSGRYFKSNWNAISKAANDLNSQAIGAVVGEITLNEWFDALGLDSIELGDYLGWSLPSYGGSGLIDIEISSHLTNDGVPCGAISYKQQPRKLNDGLY